MNWWSATIYCCRFGYPTDASTSPKWPFYSAGPLAAEGAPFAVYLIDGRFRVACALASLLHGGTESLLLVHDFSTQPGVADRGYGVLLELGAAEKLDGCCGDDGNRSNNDILVVLRRRPGVSDAELRAMWRIWQYDVA